MFYGISTFVGYIVPNPVNMYKYIYACVCVYVCVCVSVFVRVLLGSSRSFKHVSLNSKGILSII